MPRVYHRKTKRGAGGSHWNWRVTDLEQAVAAVREHRMSRKQASNAFGVPQTTIIQNHIPIRGEVTVWSLLPFLEENPV